MRTCLFAFLLVVSAWAFAADELELERYKGSVVVVDFWASWCVPCRRSFPWMNEMQEKYRDDGLVFLAVNVDKDAANATKFLEEFPARFEIVYNPDATIAKAHKVEVMPTSIVFDRDGEPLTRHSGFKVKKQDQYEAILREALGLAPAGSQQ